MIDVLPVYIQCTLHFRNLATTSKALLRENRDLSQKHKAVLRKYRAGVRQDRASLVHKYAIFIDSMHATFLHKSFVFPQTSSCYK